MCPRKKDFFFTPKTFLALIDQHLSTTQVILESLIVLLFLWKMLETILFFLPFHYLVALDCITRRKNCAILAILSK